MRDVLIETGRQFAARGWMLGTSGSLSVRVGDDPLRVLITVSGVDKGALAADHFLEVSDFTGIADPKASSEAFFKGGRRPSGETLVHEALYRRFPDASACFHVHTVAGTVVSLDGPTTYADLEMLKGIGRWEPGATVTVPVVPNHPDIPELAAAVAAAADPAVPGVLVAGHGIYAWGPDAERCKRHVEIFEFLFQVAVARR